MFKKKNENGFKYFRHILPHWKNLSFTQQKWVNYTYSEFITFVGKNIFENKNKTRNDL